MIIKATVKCERAKKRRERQTESEAANVLISLKKASIYTTEDPSQNNDINFSDGEIPKNNFNCQTDLTSPMITSMEQELIRLRQENYEMKTSLESFSFCENSFSTSDERVRFYTGLPNYIILITLYNFIGAHVTVSSRNSLTKFQQFIMVLMHLRLNLSVQYLAYRFHISKSTVSRTFLQWIDILYTRMKPLIIWPERDALRKTMPLEFRKYLMCLGGCHLAINFLSCAWCPLSRPNKTRYGSPVSCRLPVDLCI